jgi:hypothetical protein
MNLRHGRLVPCRASLVGRAFLNSILGLSAVFAGGRLSQADEKAPPKEAAFSAEPKPSLKSYLERPAQDAAISTEQKEVLKAYLERRIAELQHEGKQLLDEHRGDHPELQAKKEQLLEAQRTLAFLAETRPATSAALDFLLQAGEEREIAKIDEQKARLAQHAAELQKRERQLAMIMQQVQAGQAGPIEGGQLQKFNLAHVAAADAVEKILALFGAQTIRASIDNRTNSLIIYGKADALKQIGELLTQIDSPDDNSDADPTVSPVKGDDVRSMLLRVFWLADGLPEGEGGEPAKYLPVPVIGALEQLGLSKPRLVAQTVNSLASTKGSSANFSTNAPAILFKQPAQLSCSGEMEPAGGDRTKLRLQMNVVGHVGCDLSGSLVTPLGHYMVLGTANSIAGSQPTASMGMEGTPGGYGGFSGRGGYGGEFGRGYGGEMGRGEMAIEEGESEKAPETEGKAPTYHTSRFAFVVQVIDGASYPPDDGR